MNDDDDDDADDDCLIMIMIVAPCCARYFRKERDLLSYKDLEAGRPQLMRTLSSALTSEIGSENRLVECYYYNYFTLYDYYHCCCCCRGLNLLSGLHVLRPYISSLLQRATAYFITKCDSFFITKFDKCYYKVRHV